MIDIRVRIYRLGMVDCMLCRCRYHFLWDGGWSRNLLGIFVGIAYR